MESLLMSLGQTQSSQTDKTQSQALLRRKDDADSHSINATDNASQSLFASYIMGPLDTSGSNANTQASTAATQPANGMGSSLLSQNMQHLITAMQSSLEA